ncbi:Crp/Fnr family transcriptional regulator, partial [Mesorhizobium sp. M7A.F.Ca.CA.004.05.1.1]
VFHDDQSALIPELKLQTYPPGYHFETADAVSSSVYFICSGVAGVIARNNNSGAAGIALVGQEGMTGAALAFGVGVSAHDYVALTSCDAYALEAGRLTEAFARSPNMRLLVIRYFYDLAAQFAGSAFANARQTADAKIARMLLMLQDRLPQPLPITHAQLALMLGTRRPGVTLALQTLEGMGYIRAGRGKISVVDRDGLIEMSDGVYSAAERQG